MSSNFRHRRFSARTERSRQGVKEAFSNVTSNEYDGIVRKALLGAGKAM